MLGQEGQAHEENLVSKNFLKELIYTNYFSCLYRIEQVNLILQKKNTAGSEKRDTSSNKFIISLRF